LPAENNKRKKCPPLTLTPERKGRGRYRKRKWNDEDSRREEKRAGENKGKEGRGRKK